MKRKEKQLTLEEIKAKLIQQSQESWIHSDPLLALLPTTEGMKPLPLSPAIEQALTVILLFDFTEYAFELLLSAVERFSEEYKGLPWKVIIAFEPKYLFLKDLRFFDRFRSSKLFSQIPLYIDQRGEWFDHFKAKEASKIVLLDKGQEVLNFDLKSGVADQIARFEKTFQDALRVEDPGLPLLEAVPRELKSPGDRRICPARELTLGGNWIQGGDFAVSEDSNANLSFFFEGTRLRLVGIPHPNARESTRFVVLFNDEPIVSAHYGSAIRLGDKGTSVSEIDRTHGIFEIIDSENTLKGTIKIRFLNALENPIIIYGVRAA